MASLILILATVISADKPASSSNTAIERPFHEYQRELSDLLKRESQAKEPTGRATAVKSLCQLHVEIVHDSRYSTSDVLKEYRGQIWSRLNKVKQELKRQLARSKTNKEALDNLAVLEAADSLSAVAADSLATSLSLLEQSQNGPAGIMAFGGGAVGPDFGPDLIALIERTINPSFWDTVGGPGSIYYYRPLMCLVVRATAEVHEQIGGVVGDLRK